MQRQVPTDVVLFSTADWDNPFWTNKQHTAIQMVRKGYRVLYVESLGLRQPTMHASDAARILHRLRKALPMPRKVEENIWRISPLVLPWHKYRLVRLLNAVLLRIILLWVLRVLHFRKPIIWTYNPVISSLCRFLPKSLLVYHCVDDLGAAPFIDAAMIRNHERQLSKIADLCFVTSRELENKMKGLFAHVIYEPNVCDPELFGSARFSSFREPEDFRHIPSPRAIFVGALSQYKVDFALIEYVARRHPELNWILIGKSGEGEPGSELPPELPNVFLLGPKPYSEIPSYLAHSTLAVLPAPINDYTRSMFPMKFFEYLAAGLPVVATQLPALEEFHELSFLSDSPKDFEENIQRVLEGERKDAQRIEQCCEYYSYNKRFDRIEAVTQDAIREKMQLKHAMAGI